jgi:peptidoglycan hydrolase-like protein with peptidoglycan-binding domain
MITRLVALGDRTTTRRTTLALAALAVIALAATLPASAGAATRHATPVLAQGAGMGAKPSAAVRQLQRTLQRQGYHLGRPGADGRFGPLTAAAVRRLQSNYGLRVDGIVGAKTRKLLRLAQRHSRPSTTKARRPSTTKGSAPSRTTTGRTIPQRVPTRTIIERRPIDLGWLVVIAAAAALGVLLGAFGARGLPKPRRANGTSRTVTPVEHELYVEGHSYLEGVGAFRGRALATAITGPSGDEPAEEQTMYLVHDASKRAPVWVHSTEIQRANARLGRGEPVIGYVTMAPGAERSAADEPARAIERACADAGWNLLEVVTDREDGPPLDRPGLVYALEQIADGTARGIVVAELGRLSRSIVDLGAFMEWFRDANAALVALDLDLDTSTATGQELAASTIRLAGWERERSAPRRQGVTQFGPRGLRPVRDPAEPSDLDPREQMPSLEGRRRS